MQAHLSLHFCFEDANYLAFSLIRVSYPERCNERRS